MNTPGYLLLRALRSPHVLPGLSQRDWDVLLCQAREGHVLARLAFQLDALGATGGLPPKVRDHLESAQVLAAEGERVVRWEVPLILRALAAADVPVILLKGAAYIMAGLPPARGRFCSDIDILVSRAKLKEVEEALLCEGWEMEGTNPYDEHYYRTWTHELPPLVHRERGTVLDVHHNLTPTVGRVPVDAAALLAAARPLGGKNLWVLAPADMVLHCATHLFQDGEVDRALRDLTDLDDLLRHFGADPGFWEGLAARARQLSLVTPLCHALGARRDLLGAPPPDELTGALRAGGPGWPASRLVGASIRRALLPGHPEPVRWGTGPARWLLYLRAHWQRMPLPLLTYHLARKGFAGLFAKPKAS
jgi:hypothetical protein